VVLSLALLLGCGSSQASDSAVKETVERGVAQLREPQTTEQLHDDLVHTLRQLRGEHASTATGRNGRALSRHPDRQAQRFLIHRSKPDALRAHYRPKTQAWERAPILSWTGKESH